MQSEDERVALMAADKVFERAWGRPKEYDPNAEAPKKAPPFDPSLYTTEELRRGADREMTAPPRRFGTIAKIDGRGRSSGWRECVNHFRLVLDQQPGDQDRRGALITLAITAKIW